MLAVGRWASNLVRFFLQRILIVGKRLYPMQFKRTLLFSDQVRLVDEIWNIEKAGRPSRKVTALYAGTDHTSIYVAVSRSYQSACLLPWTDYGGRLEKLNRDGYVRIERILE
jgi:hypothetical protein